jgi:hypothetical protein
MIKRAAQAWAFASILLLPNYIDLTSSAGDARMRSPVPLTKIALAQLSDLLIVALIFAAIMALLRRLRVWPKVRWALLAVLPILLLIRNLNVFPFDVPWIAVFGAACLWFALLAVLFLRAPAAAIKLRTAGSSLLTGFAVFALVMTWQLCRAAVWKPGAQAIIAKPTAPAAANRPRLVWIIFDELALKPTFEERDPSLKLPNFDRLRSESTLYTDVTPIAYRTTHAVPSLLSGHEVTDVDFTAENRYLVQTTDDPTWKPFDASTSLFGAARRRGLTTSVVGWYIAYCPIFASVITDCYWSNDDAQDRGPTLPSANFLDNVMFPLRILVEQAFAPSRAWSDAATLNAEGHIASVKDLSQHALDTVATSQSDILYLHLPAPHPPAFWNRRTATFAIGGSYLDSLDYSDRLLGRILNILEAQPRWAATTLIVQGDHSWRTAMWRPLPGWGAEDERASHGGAWDPRPVVMIHAPGQKAAETVSAPTSVMIVHDRVAERIENWFK